MSTGVTEVRTKETEEVHQDVKYSSLSPYTLKPTSLITEVFKDNKKAQEKLSKHVCNFGSRTEWINGRRAVSYYLDAEIRKYQNHLLNPTP